jgi:error-prone DNA polymerase
MLPVYAELDALSNYSFLQGASHPEELVHRACALGYRAFALADECSVAGVVRAHLAAKDCGLHLIVGARFRVEDWPAIDRLLLLAADRDGYGNLCELVSLARARAPKGQYRLFAADLQAGLAGCLAIAVPAAPAMPLAGTAAEASRGVDPSSDDARGEAPSHAALSALRDLARAFAGGCWIGVSLLRGPDDGALLAQARALGERAGLPLVACGAVRMHVRERRQLHDVLTAIRSGEPLHALGARALPNAERCLHPIGRLARLYPAELLAQTVDIAARCTFSLQTLRYEYPRELVPEGETASRWLRRLVQEGLAQRYPAGVPAAVSAQVDHELALVAELGYEPYFLTVHDIVRFARGRGILCQGRGSAANSAVCYALGITEVDPSRMQVLFERFISRERNEPPDIDVDFEHARREEVVQYLYERYGRDRAALTAALATYRPRSALRDVGRAFGLSLDQVDRLARTVAWWDGNEVSADRLVEAGFDADNPLLAQVLEHARELLGFPRHLTQHSGGFVIARDRLTRLVPVENAAMDGRTVIQWDKDDLDALGLLKVDVLALGMLTAVRRALDALESIGVAPPREPVAGPVAPPSQGGAGSCGSTRATRHSGATLARHASGVSPCASGEVGGAGARACPAAGGRGQACGPSETVVRAVPGQGEIPLVRPAPGMPEEPPSRWRLQDIPPEDPATYAMIQRADTIGVFQIESRAQMTMLPRLRPACFYDLVIEVAIVRPGPIQGGMVHPYLRRRQGLEPVAYPSEAVRGVLERTLGVSIFQEQVMQLVVVAAGFSAGEADQVRRAMAAWRRRGGLEPFRERLIDGMRARGYSEAYALQIYQQILGFGEYGFPESHAASFALLVYVSSWLKCHHPAAFACGLLNAQPMGFYSPSAIVQDAQRHGVRVLAPDVTASGWDCSLEPDRGAGGPETAEPPSDRQVRQAAEPPSVRQAAHPAGRLAPGGSRGADAARAPAAGHSGGTQAIAGPALRLGLRSVKGLSEAAARRIERARARAPFADVADLARRARLDRGELATLASADALASLAGHRREAAWAALGHERDGALVPAPREAVQPSLLPPEEGEQVVLDYARLGLTLRSHPLALLRPRLAGRRLSTARQFRAARDGQALQACGLVTCRQRPATAGGAVFLTLEDETGYVNVVVWGDLAERHRREVLDARLLVVQGRVQREGEVVHLVARRLVDETRLLGRLVTRSRDFG